MDDTLVSEIEDIRTRLGEIADEREDQPAVADSHRDELLAEEHRLETRLTELEDRLATKESGVAEEKAGAQTDLTHSPKLPEDEDEQ